MDVAYKCMACQNPCYLVIQEIGNEEPSRCVVNLMEDDNQPIWLRI